jgi:hypothetical protein
VEYLKKTPRPPGADKGMDLAGKALTTKGDRPRATWGSLIMTTQDIPGLCQRDLKCIRKDRHDGECWPTTQAKGG